VIARPLKIYHLTVSRRRFHPPATGRQASPTSQARGPGRRAGAPTSHQTATAGHSPRARSGRVTAPAARRDRRVGLRWWSRCTSSARKVASPNGAPRGSKPPASRLESTPGPPPSAPAGNARERGSYRTPPRPQDHRAARTTARRYEARSLTLAISLSLTIRAANAMLTRACSMDTCVAPARARGWTPAVGPRVRGQEGAGHLVEVGPADVRPAGEWLAYRPACRPAVAGITGLLAISTASAPPAAASANAAGGPRSG
jgi:hypothetical protein